jgi:hypothetical protein
MYTINPIVYDLGVVYFGVLFLIVVFFLDHLFKIRIRPLQVRVMVTSG